MISRNRVSASQMLASSPARTSSNSFPRLSEILVNLSVKEQKKVVRKLKLVGDPYAFTEYIDKKYVPNPTNDPGLKGKTVRVPFPDADLNKSFNRIGNDDNPEMCPWAKLGYISTTQYAQNCFEKQDDGTWVVKILKKGKSIFNKIAQDIAENYNDDTNDDGDGRHYGTRSAPCVRITAEATGKQPPLSVNYTVAYDKKPTYIDDVMIELLRKAGEPTPDDLINERKSYEYDSKEDPYMPAWEDFYTYGYPLNKIFKFDAIRSDEETETVSVPAKQKYVEAEIEPVVDFALTKKARPVQEDDDEPVVPVKPTRAKVVVEEEEDDDAGYQVKPPVKAAPKRLPVTIDEDEDDEDGSTMGWIGK